MKNMHCKSFICIMLSLIMLTGCAYASDLSFDTLQKNDSDNGLSTLGLAPAFDYEVPESLPSILVDQLGYAVSGNKVAVFQGELLPDTFAIIDADSGKSVYTGRSEQRGYDEETGVLISYGDFTSFRTTGTYYIEASVIGLSYTFEIAENPY